MIRRIAELVDELVLQSRYGELSSTSLELCGSTDFLHSNKGSCVCPADQCNDRCVDLKTHPKNCGSCGNVCSSNYCFQGQCFTPPPDKCAPGEAFVKEWEAGAGTLLKPWDPVANANDTSTTTFVAAKPGDTYWRMRTPTSAEVLTYLRMCPGQAYELSYSLLSIGAYQGPPGCTFKYRIGAYTATWTAAGDFPGGGRTSIGNSGYGVSSKGPIDVGPYQGGDWGETQVGLNLEVPFVARVECAGSFSGALGVQFSAVPST